MKKIDNPMFSIRNSEDVKLSGNITSSERLADLDNVRGFNASNNIASTTVSEQNNQDKSFIKKAIKSIVKHTISIVVAIISSIAIYYLGFS
ncbi:hypothetical protein RKT74_13395 [Leclercia pneumoniae]|uniref:hypothetical protein n=1 Tax=Leclercia pneumoniae TaxID=2815358 RepID=UPI0021E52D25|nr:hypothetical protein [Leclercia pneumoniae]MCV2510170.1 hypothetical protein [Leclercia pneumoniae]WNN79725.1 hypothetical protein RKT74_13395 [Leclercia pneumoniae]